MKVESRQDELTERFDIAPVGFLLLNLEGEILQANAAAADLLGSARETLEGRLFSGWVHRCATEALEGHLHAVFNGAGKHAGDLKLLRQDGGILAVRAESILFQHSQKKLNRCLMVLVDITQRVTTEEILLKSEKELALLNRELEQRGERRSVALEESECRFQVVFNEAPNACFLLSLEGKIIAVNHAAEKVIGYSESELEGESLFSTSFLYEESAPIALKRFSRLVEGEEVAPFEVLLLRKDGTEVPVELSHHVIMLRGQAVVLGNVRDLAAQKQAEMKLEDSEVKYRSLFESLSDSVLMFDADTRCFVDVNQAAIDSYGYSYDEFMHLTHGDISAEPAAADLEIRKTIFGMRPRPMILSRHRKKDGTVIPVEISSCSFPVRGRLVVCGVVRDISERVAQEGELARHQAEVRRFAAELSVAEQRERERVAQELHDGVSQMLSSSCFHLDLLKETRLSEPAVETLNTVGKILRDTLAQIHTLTFELSCPLLNELGLAAALEELCVSMSRDDSVRFVFEGDVQPLGLPLDREIMLYRSVRELLMNVMKHSGSNWARVCLGRANNHVCLSVKDGGAGFDAAVAGAGFSPSGGFGLFNMRENLHHAGGTLWLESIPGEGTEVVLKVPLEKSDEKAD